MFDIERARKKGVDENSIAIMQKINENNKKEKSCDKHDFEKVKIKGIPKYRCKKCGCVKNVEWICGYNRGIQHGQKR